MPDVKVLIAASENFTFAERGDVVEVVSSQQDWGGATVVPDWIRLTIRNVPGGTQQIAEDRIRAYLGAWEGEFLISEVEGAGLGEQRYRVQASPEIANDFDLADKLEIRDRILNRFDGTVANQSPTHFEFDSYPGIPLDEVQFEIGQISTGVSGFLTP